ncbi:hypothetical protein GW17_00024726 [Ensete ventricosum]|nr:hypothetical protein GW17_00024726 [Ensete ventricosum]
MQSVTLHTNLGDIKCEVFCDEVPKTAEDLKPKFMIYHRARADSASRQFTTKHVRYFCQQSRRNEKKYV